MQPDDIGRLVSVSDPRVAPDGRQVAFVVTRVDLAANRYRSAVWLAAADGSVPPYPLTDGEDDATCPRWSPDGRRLALSRRGTGPDASSTLQVLPVGVPGATLRVCERPESIGELAWSPDGTLIAFTSRERAPRYGDGDDDRARPPRRIDRLFSRLDDEGWTIDRPRGVFVVRSDATEPATLVLGGPYEHDGPAWSPDGRTLAVTAPRGEDRDLEQVSDVYLVDVEAALGREASKAEPRSLTRTDRSYAHPSFGPDGTRVATLANDDRVSPSFSDVVVLDPGTGDGRAVTDGLDRQCAPYPGARSPIWDGDAVVFAVEDHGDVHLYRVPADGSAPPERVVGGTRAVNDYDLAGGTLAFVAATPTSLAEVFVVRDGAERRLTDVGSGFRAAVPVSAPEHFTVASPGGGDVDAWLVRPLHPAGDGLAPVLLSIHGGPATQYANTFFDEFQLWAGAGYAVVYCNPHGSTGDTQAWARAIRPPEAAQAPGSGWGSVDADDVLAVLDAAIAREPGLDPDRVGVLGGSYGGFLTSWLVGHTDRFAAACSERAVNNLESEETSADAAGFFRFEMGASHLDAPQLYRRMSPISYVRDITTPLLVLHSENDLRCPVEQADQLFVALRLLGREVEYWRFPEEGHELSRSGSPRHRVQRAQLILDWFGRHLGGRRPTITWDHPARVRG